MSESNSKKPLKMLGGFEILEKIGAGAMGAVFQARQRSMDRVVALKVLPPKLAKDGKFVARFLREARASAALNHPNIVQGIDVGQDEPSGLYYFAMELVEGETLGRRLKREGRLPEKEVVEIGRQTALALAHAHGKGLIHRDIKPENLMRTPDPGRGGGFTLKVMDLGLARAIEDDAALTQSGMAVGTPYYLSPEQAWGEKTLQPACDLYALGGTLLHLVSGKAPYQGATSAVIVSKHLTAPTPNPKAMRPDISNAFAALLKKLLAKKPGERYPSAQALAEDLERLQKGEPLRHVRAGRTAPSTGPLRPVTRRATARRAPVTKDAESPSPTPDELRGKRSGPFPLWLLGAGVAVLLAGLGVWLASSSGTPPPARPQREAEPSVAVRKTITKKSAPEKETAKVPPRPAPVSPEEAKRQRLEKKMAAARRTQAEDPRDFERQEKAWNELKRAAQGTPFEEQAVEELAKLAQARKRAAETAVQAAKTLVAQAQQKAQAGDFDAALARLKTGGAPRVAPPVQALLDAAARAIRARAEEKGNRQLAQAAQQRAAGQLAQALKTFQAAAAFRYAPVAAKARQQLRTAEAALAAAREKAEEAAAARLAKLVTELQKEVGRRDFEGARARIAKAKREALLAPKAALLRALEESLASLPLLHRLAGERLAQSGKAGLKLPQSGKIYTKLEHGRLYYRLGPIPTDQKVETVPWSDLLALAGFTETRFPKGLQALPEEQRAALGGLLALAGRVAWARRLFQKLRKEGGPTLSVRVALWEEPLAVLEYGAAESAAALRFGRLEQRVAKKQWAQAERQAEALLGKRLGRTAFVKQHRAEIEKLEDRVLDALAERDAARVPLARLVRGKLKKLPGGYVELRYDFQEPKQLADFKALTPNWSIQNGRLEASKKPNDALLWLAVPFQGETLEVSFVGDAPMDLNCLLGPEIKQDTTGGYSFRFGRTKNSLSEVLTLEGKSLKKNGGKLRHGQPNQVRVKRDGKHFVGQLNGAAKPLQFDADEALGTHFVALQTWEGAWYDELAVKGKLDARWVRARRREILRKERAAAKRGPGQAPGAAAPPPE